MEKLDFNLENCYGIKKLEGNFDFSNKNTVVIYANNGSMKTSFAKIFEKYQKGNECKKIDDYIFGNTPVVHNIKINKKIIKDTESNDNIFVIKSFDESYYSKNISKTLLREEDKKEYDTKIEKLDSLKILFLNKVKEKVNYTPSYVKGVDSKTFKYLNENQDLEDEILNLFKNDEKISKLDFYRVLLKIEKDVLNSNSKYSDIKYTALFNAKTIKMNSGKIFLQKYKEYIKKYIEIYIGLIEDSNYFNKEFNYQNAEKALNDLDKKYGYFSIRENSLKNGFQLFNKKNKKLDKITKEEFEGLIVEIKSKIDENISPEGVKLDIDIDKNKELKEFKEYLLRIDLDFLNEFKTDLDSDLRKSRKTLFLSYFKYFETDFLNFIKEVKIIFKEIEDIIKKIKDDKYIWFDTVKEFNDRFDVPFNVYIDKDEMERLIADDLDILTLKYRFCDGEREKCEKNQTLWVEKNKADLIGRNGEDSILSQGEKRAFYLLNIIFEIKSREKENKKTLFIIDDIADSFDYKNKYAIVEYLKEISEHKNFYQIILTHNFDFFRIIKNRFDEDEKDDWCYLVEKEGNQMKLKPFRDDINNPFNLWLEKVIKKEGGCEKYIIAMIPLVRNLLEYSGDKNGDYDKLNDILHGRNNWNENKLEELEKIFHNYYEKQEKIEFKDDIKDKKIEEVINNICNEILENKQSSLENKIILSIAIRMKTEIYLRNKLGKKNTSKSPMWKLVDEYKSSVDEHKIFKRVKIMTPENIHINSFMYEPILDMGINELIKLYQDILDVIKN